MKEELKNMSEESLKNLEEIVESELLPVEDIRERLEFTEKGKTRQTIQNCKYVLENDPCLKGVICRNEMTCQIDIRKEVPWKRRGLHMTDTDMNNLSLYLEQNYGLTSDRVITKAVDIVANENSFHPIIEYLETLVWDGEPRVKKMLSHFFGVEDEAYAGELMQMHMMAAIKRLYEPGTKYDIMLCLVGGQGTGKSTFFRFLAIEDDYFTDDMKRIDDKKAYEYLQGHWIVEMSEMNAVANAKSIEETKAFLSRQKDTYRIPYERRAEDRYRQCVFCGTSNDFAFLPFDRTGNRRFGPVKVRPEKAEVKVYADEEEARNYIIQAWAESMEIYKSGEYRLTFSPAMEDYVKTLQKEFMPEDTQTGLIQTFLDRYEGDYVCTTIIYQEVFHQDGIVPKWQSKEIGDLLDNEIVGWTKHGNHRFRGALGTQRAWKRNNPKHVALEYKEHNADEAECSEKIDEQMEIPFD